MRFGRILPLAAAAVLGLAQTALAERITLKNGYDIEGWIVEESKAEVVVAIIERGAVGKLTIDPADIEHIDRTRRETLEEALERYQREMQEAARLSLPQPTTSTAGAAPGAAEGRPGAAAQPGAPGASDGPSDVAKPEIPAIFPPPTAEEREKIAAGINGIGDTRHAGGAATRRETARKSLVAIGLPAVPALNEALVDGNWYRRMNAASAIAEIAPQDRRLELWKDVVPRLIGVLEDEVAFVRAAANQALEAISGTNVDYPNPRAGEPNAEERAAIDRWAKWWEAARRDLRS